MPVRTWGGVELGVLTEFVNKGAVFMVAFFMLSGFSLCYTYFDKEILDFKELKKFYWKRICSLYPLYLICHILYVITLGNLSWKKNIFVLPIELTAIQSTLNGFNILHNGGTWFISCLSFCYFLFPFFIYLIKNMRKTTQKIVVVSILLIDIWAPFITFFFELDTIYSNPFYRMLDFVLGMFCACFFVNHINKKHSNLCYFKAFIVIVIYAALLTFCVRYKIPDTYRSIKFVTFCNYLTVPTSIILLLLFSRAKEIICIKKPLKIFSDISYAFFLAQFWVWDITEKIMNLLVINRGYTIVKIMIAFVICFAFSYVATYYIDKPIKKKILGIADK